MRGMAAGWVGVGLLMACGGGGAARDSRETAAVGASSETSATASDTGAGESSGASMAAGGTPDARFLMMMADHHQGLIELSRRAGMQGTDASTRGDATRLATKQEEEQQRMLAKLQQLGGMTHEPMVMPKNARTTDSVASLQGPARQQAFYAAVIAHHREGIKMADSAGPALQDSAVRSMASKMKQEQQREITEFQPKAMGRRTAGS